MMANEVCGKSGIIEVVDIGPLAIFRRWRAHCADRFNAKEPGSCR